MVIPGAVSQPTNPIKITLFYESYCPFSIKFMLQQLYPVTMKYSKLLVLDLIPFGHCKVQQRKNGMYDFKCQHGEKECYGNRVHACVIQQGVDKGNAKVVMALTCLMNYNYQDMEVKRCLEKSNLSWDRHKLCMLRDATTLEVAYGKRTHENVPEVKYVPFVIFNDTYNHHLEEIAVNNLEAAVCELFGPNKPDTCFNYNLI